MFCFSIASCNQAKPGSAAIKIVNTSPDTTNNKQPGFALTNNIQVDNLGDFGKLSPIKILNPKSKNVYEKYGIDFEGNCYNCDLAIIQVTKKHFDIVNICDKKDFYRIENFTYEAYPNGLKIKTEKNEFIFTKIETAPVYELKILGDKILFKKKRIAKFYTQEKELNKFKQHDCGEFDG